MSATGLWAPLVALLLVSGGALAAPAESDIVVPPGESVADRSQEQWSRAWWQWAGSFSSDDSPIADRTGLRCAARQEGSVWFLAGTYGTQRTTRQCTVPAGRFLFFPLINYVVMPPRSRAVSCEAVTREAARVTDDVSSLILEVDGLRIDDLLAQRQATSTCFSMGDLAGGRTPVYPVAANGYYVMLRPLAKGRHTLNFGGALPSMLQAVTYTLEVE